MVLPLALFALIILGILSLAAFETSQDAMRAGRAFRESGLALYAAEGGMRYVTGNWPGTQVSALNPGDSLDLGWRVLPNRARYRAVITRVDGGGLQSYSVVVQGRGGVVGRYAGQRIVTSVVRGVPFFTFAVWSRGNLSITGNTSATVVSDAYNSSEGPYYAPTADSVGSLGANGTISTTGTILGDVTAGSTVSLNGGAVTGTVTQNATNLPDFPPVACPTTGYTPAGSMPVGIGSLYSYNALTGVLSVSGGKNLILGAPPTQYYFSSVTLSGGSTLTLSTGGQHVDIYVDGTATLSGGGIINTNAKAPELSLWGCGTPGSTTTWTLSGGSGAYYTVYAPNHPIVISGSSSFYGALVGNGITASGGSKFHYDEALMEMPSSKLAVVRGSWAELTLY